MAIMLGGVHASAGIRAGKANGIHSGAQMLVLPPRSTDDLSCLQNPRDHSLKFFLGTMSALLQKPTCLLHQQREAPGRTAPSQSLQRPSHVSP